MEGQGKRLLLAVALALGVMLVWNMIFPSKPDDQQQAGSGSQVSRKGYRACDIVGLERSPLSRCRLVTHVLTPDSPGSDPAESAR